MVDGKSRLTTRPCPHGILPSRSTSTSRARKLLILITEFGDRGDVQDHADWVEARIIR